MNIESQLGHLLRRVEPPPGFTARVIRVVEAEHRRPRRRYLRALAAAALIAASLGGWGIHITLRARNDVLTAMRIASQKVAQAQREVRGVSR